jgi:hypothetical protein
MGASSPSSASSSSAFAHPHKGWSKQNLRAGERSAWTRGRDGWSGVGVGGYGSMVEGSGEVRFVFFVFHFSLSSGFPLCIWLDRVFPHLSASLRFVEMIDILIRFLRCCFYYSSNLTFSLAPGWAFVESEDWRKDVQCAWSGCGGDAGMCRCFFVFVYVEAYGFLLAFCSSRFLALCCIV